MNNEESRLRTFSAWPSDAIVTPVRIAKAGFYYTGQGLEVQCFACGGKISEWNYGDQVMAKHRRLDPNCPFVINPSTSGNVPKISRTSSAAPTPSAVNPTSSQTSLTPLVSYRTETSRLESFLNWPCSNIVSPVSLAKAGFYYLEIEDKVKCPFCDGIAGFWERDDDPKAEHRRHFPNCAFVLADFNLNQLEGSQNSNQISNGKLVSGNNLQELGIQAHKGPRQPRYSTLESRLRTFGNWSSDLLQTPAMLSDAGFYYVGTGDQVRCFHCDGGLRHWDPEDEPWVEHARWFPTCAYVRLIKGERFIQSCNPQDLPHNNLTPNNPRQQINGRTPNSRPREFSDSDIQTYMNLEPALTALSIGLPVGRVKQAIRQKIQDTGTSYTSPHALIEAALNLQLEESDQPSETDYQVFTQVDSNILPRVGVVEQGKQEVSAPPVARNETKEDTSPKLSLEEENRQLKEARLCKICMDNEIGVVFLPCGHLTTCVTCAPSLKDCPVCRSVIKGTVRTFLS